MERVSAKEKGRKKLIRDKANALKEAPPRRAPSKSVIKQAGRYHAIETAKKQLNEARQTVTPDQEQQPYTAADKVESYAVNLAHEIVPPSRYQPKEQYGNVSHGETHYSDPQPAKAPTLKERMRRQMIEEIKQERAEASRERSKNLSLGETSFDDELKPDARPKEQLRRSTIRKDKRKQKEVSDRESSAHVQYPSKGKPERVTQPSETIISSKRRKGQRQKALPQTSSASAKTELAKKQGKGAVSLYGKMIDAPIVARAMQTIAMAEALGLDRRNNNE